MAENLMFPDDMPRDLQRELAIDHARHGQCWYRRDPEDGRYARIKPHMLAATEFGLAASGHLLDVMAGGL